MTPYLLERVKPLLQLFYPKNYSTEKTSGKLRRKVLNMVNKTWRLYSNWMKQWPLIDLIQIINQLQVKTFEYVHVWPLEKIGSDSLHRKMWLIFSSNHPITIGCPTLTKKLHMLHSSNNGSKFISQFSMKLVSHLRGHLSRFPRAPIGLQQTLRLGLRADRTCKKMHCFVIIQVFTHWKWFVKQPKICAM